MDTTHLPRLVVRDTGSLTTHCCDMPTPSTVNAVALKMGTVSFTGVGSVYEEPEVAIATPSGSTTPIVTTGEDGVSVHDVHSANGSCACTVVDTVSVDATRPGDAAFAIAAMNAPKPLGTVTDTTEAPANVDEIDVGAAMFTNAYALVVAAVETFPIATLTMAVAVATGGEPMSKEGATSAATWAVIGPPYAAQNDGSVAVDAVYTVDCDNASHDTMLTATCMDDDASVSLSAAAVDSTTTSYAAARDADASVSWSGKATALRMFPRRVPVLDAALGSKFPNDGSCAMRSYRCCVTLVDVDVNARRRDGEAGTAAASAAVIAL